MLIALVFTKFVFSRGIWPRRTLLGTLRRSSKPPSRLGRGHLPILHLSKHSPVANSSLCHWCANLLGTNLHLPCFRCTLPKYRCGWHRPNHCAG